MGMLSAFCNSDARESASLAPLILEYRLLSLEGQGEASVIEQVVPVVARGTAEDCFGKGIEMLPNITIHRTFGKLCLPSSDDFQR